MENIRHAYDFRCLKYRARIERKPLGIVRIVARRQTIECVAIKERWILDKIELHSGALASIQDRAEPVLVIEWNGHAGQNCLRGFEFGLLVARKIDCDVVA